MEINARFGGGFPLAARAGADYPRWLIEEQLGGAAPIRHEWSSGIAMLRYDAEIFVEYASSGGCP